MQGDGEIFIPENFTTLDVKEWFFLRKVSSFLSSTSTHPLTKIKSRQIGVSSLKFSNKILALQFWQFCCSCYVSYREIEKITRNKSN